VSHLVASADRRAAIASRAMSIAVGFASLGIAALVAARHALPALDAAAESWGIALGVAVIASMALAYIVAMRLADRSAA